MCQWPKPPESNYCTNLLSQNLEKFFGVVLCMNYLVQVCWNRETFISCRTSAIEDWHLKPLWGRFWGLFNIASHFFRIMSLFLEARRCISHCVWIISLWLSSSFSERLFCLLEVTFKCSHIPYWNICRLSLNLTSTVPVHFQSLDVIQLIDEGKKQYGKIYFFQDLMQCSIV